MVLLAFVAGVGFADGPVQQRPCRWRHSGLHHRVGADAEPASVDRPGLIEAMNPEGDEYGGERLTEVLWRVAPLAADDTAAALSAELKRWIQTGPPHDDLTFLILKAS